VSLLLRQTCGSESRGAVHVSLRADNPSVSQIHDDRRFDLSLYTAGLAALVLAYQDNHPVTDIDELLRFHPVLSPNLVFAFEAPSDLVGATEDLAFFNATDRSVLLNARIVERGRPVPIQVLEALERLPHDLHVLLRHRLRSISPSGAPAYGH